MMGIDRKERLTPGYPKSSSPEPHDLAWPGSDDLETTEDGGGSDTWRPIGDLVTDIVAGLVVDEEPGTTGA